MILLSCGFGFPRVFYYNSCFLDLSYRMTRLIAFFFLSEIVTVKDLAGGTIA